MSRQLMPGMARLCPTELGSSIEEVFSEDHQPAVLEQQGAAEPEHLPKDRAKHALSSSRQMIGERQDNQRYLSRREVRRLLPVSDMTIWRWQHDPVVAFPKPVKLGRAGRNFWWLPDILEWERRRAASCDPGHGEGHAPCAR